MRNRVVRALLAFAFITPVCAASPLAAQQARVGDLAISDVDVPVRVMGYGLVVGLDGSGDRAIGGYGARHTVQSVVNLLRNFGVEVPAEVLRTRNVAAVLVTAEASAFLRPGGRFEVSVASVGDAVSLRGGVLWATPLVYEAGGPAVATAQGPVLLSEGAGRTVAYSVETSARIPDGGLLLDALPAARFASTARLVLREPNLGTATRIAAAINGAIPDAARVEDPGSIALTLAADSTQNVATVLAQIADLRVDIATTAQVVVDTRDGTIVAGGDIAVGPAVVSHGGLTLTVGATGTGEPSPGEVRVAPGARIQDVAAALHAVGAPSTVIASIFESLQRIGSIVAEVRVR
jgi:flagellar P-ring protein precursor FlgI